ncbi:MAG: leucine--tRNA ligase [Flavobacteriales bacterium]|jgi:leucyl-tRNA synthetase|nr:leucine--tRNA ligase [Flavobacteriales bacterium]
MEYNFREIEKKWSKTWEENQVYRVENQSDKPKFYVLDMFPYPSGAGLHVGHPLGYIASDIYARFKRLKGFNVLHPMGYDAFGLPAEQYAIQTGQHPAVSTEKNTTRYREQLDKIGFSFDWSRSFKTCDEKYYQWTQWIFLKLFGSWYDAKAKKAKSIGELIAHFEENGSEGIIANASFEGQFSAQEWKSMSEKEQEDILQQFRLAFRSLDYVNWCPALGTVLANDEVKEGLSERGGHPVEKRKMWGWSLRVSAYADRLLQGLDQVDWTDSLKEQQKNWIGKSKGAQVIFDVDGHEDVQIEVFTTRPDTIFGVTFMTLAPESELVEKITTKDYQKEVEAYITQAKNKSERERQADVKNISGVFTGAFAKHPLTGENIPIWVGDYVLGSYGTGAVMAVPAHDSRDFAFANHFRIPVKQVISADGSIATLLEEAFESKNGILVNSGDFDGLKVKDGASQIVKIFNEKGIGKWKTNYRLRDAVFSRQRYWGEPIPMYIENDMPKPFPEEELPLILAEVDEYKPTAEGLAPLARNKDWKRNGLPIEPNTMPGWAGSSWYFFRYMDPDNTEEFASKEALDYWQQVDLYLGGSEHATGHLIYSRFWTKFLFDLGLVPMDEPFKKLFNQGMILGRSSFAHRIKGTNQFVSYDLKDDYDTAPIHADVAMVENDVLDTEAFKNWREDLADATFILNEKGQFLCGSEVEKMSKSKYNVVNPDDIIFDHGADTLRMYEMFLGPLDQSKPWNTQGISGVSNFLKKFWRLYHEGEQFQVSDAEPTAEELKILHKTIGKIEQDVEAFSLNTSISTFMIATNDLQKLKCNKKAILAPLLVVMAPFAPFITEELWAKMGNTHSVHQAEYPVYQEALTKDSTAKYAVAFNGKVRFQLEVEAGLSKEAVEKLAREHEKTPNYIGDKQVRKVIVVPNKMVNIVIG